MNKPEPYLEVKMHLPKNKDEWEVIKQEFLNLDLEDKPETWTFIISQLQNTKMPELSFDYETVLNHYKRWKIAEVLQKEKLVYIEQLKDKLKEALLREEAEQANGSSSSNLPDEPLDLHAVMPTLPAS